MLSDFNERLATLGYLAGNEATIEAFVEQYRKLS